MRIERLKSQGGGFVFDTGVYFFILSPGIIDEIGVRPNLHILMKRNMQFSALIPRKIPTGIVRPKRRPVDCPRTIFPRNRSKGVGIRWDDSRDSDLFSYFAPFYRSRIELIIKNEKKFNFYVRKSAPPRARCMRNFARVICLDFLFGYASTVLLAKYILPYRFRG